MSKDYMTILITGTAGFIGFHLTQKLLESNAKIIGLDSINNYYNPQLKYDRLKVLGFEPSKIEKGKILQSSLNENLYFIQLELQDKEKIFELCKEFQFEYVIHLAAQAGVRYSLENPQSYIDSNIQGFFNILEACRNFPVKHLVYASSSSVYGANDKIPFSTSDNVDHPISLYAATKKSNELMSYTYSHLFKIPTTGLRFFTVYGPWGRPDMAYFSFTKNILEGKPIQVFNYGNMKRDFTYIDDIIDGIIRVINHIPISSHENPLKNAPYKIYNLGNNKPVELNYFIEVLENLTGKKAIRIEKGMQAGDVPITYADIEDIRRDVGFEPKTNIETGLKKFVEWYIEYFKPHKT